MDDHDPAPHDVAVRVRYGETDRMGVAYHGAYLLYFEIGRTEWLRARGLAYRDVESRGLRLVVVEAHVAYHASAAYDDALTVRTRLREMRGCSMTFAYEVRRGSQVLTTGWTRLACLDASLKPTRLPGDIRALATPRAARD